MKASSLLALLGVPIGAVAIMPFTNGLEAGTISAEEKEAHLRHLSEEDSKLPTMPEIALTESDDEIRHGGGGCYRGSRFWPRCKRHLEEEQEAEIGKDLSADDAEHHAWWHGRGHGGGCYPGSRFWPRCKRHLEEEPEAEIDEDLSADDDENRGWWRGRGRGGGCYPGSRFWPRCKRHLEEEPEAEIDEDLSADDDEHHAWWHGRGRGGGCYPGSRFWPRCRAF